MQRAWTTAQDPFKKACRLVVVQSQILCVQTNLHVQPYPQKKNETKKKKKKKDDRKKIHQNDELCGLPLHTPHSTLTTVPRLRPRVQVASTQFYCISYPVECVSHSQPAGYVKQHAFASWLETKKKKKNVGPEEPWATWPPR